MIHVTCDNMFSKTVSNLYNLYKINNITSYPAPTLTLRTFVLKRLAFE